MRLPNAQNAVVERRKLTDYLLNAAHPDNGGKAAFFQALGFTGKDWPTLAAALHQLAETSVVVKNMESSHGHKYILHGRIRTPSGKTPQVQTVWIVNRGQDVPRLVTAYPHE